MATPNVEKKSFLDRFLNGLEVAGNKLPDPVTLFFILCVVIMIISHFVAAAGVSVIHPSTHKVVPAVSLIETKNLQTILGKIVSNFQGFPPLGLVLAMMLGVGVAEKSGMLEAAIKHSIYKIPGSLVTLGIIFFGICGNAAGDAAFIVLPPLAATIYYALGRHPLAGMFLAFGSVAAGFAANVIVNMSDVLAASFTIPAAQVVFPDYQSSPAMNFYFLLASTFILTVVGYLVSVKIVEPRLGKFEPPPGMHVIDLSISDTSPAEIKGLKWAGIWTFIYVIAIAVLCIGDNAFLADPKTHSILTYTSPFMQGIIPILLVLFFIPGLVYGIVSGSIKSDRDVVRMMGDSLSGMGGYIVLAFMGAQFLAFFAMSNLGIIIAVKGAEFLQNAGLVGIGIIICFILLSGTVNLFIGSASAKWAIMAPVFVPMFMLIGYDPSLTQMAYRIGDSITNPISPLFPYFPILIAYAQKYMPKCGIGTIVANMMPYSIAFAIFWTILLIIFMVLNIPLGPNGAIYFKI